MEVFRQKPFFWIICFTILIILIPLTFFIFRQQIVSGLSYLSNQLQSLSKSKPGKCLILPQEFCDQAEVLETTLLPSGKKIREIGLHIPPGKPFFMLYDAQVAPTKLDKSVIFYQGNRAVIFNPNNPKRKLIISGALRFTDMDPDKLLTLNRKQGQIFAYSSDLAIDMAGYNVIMYIADTGPDNHEIRNEEETRKLFPKAYEKQAKEVTTK